MRRLLVGAVLCGAVVLSGCATRFDGHGAMASASGTGEATFHFSFDGPKSKFHGQYEDQAKGVRIEGDGVVTFNNNPGDDNCMDAVVTYDSKERAKPGSGTARIVACDGVSEGKKPDNTGDQFGIQIQTGPFAGYTNSGNLTRGALKAK